MHETVETPKGDVWITQKALPATVRGLVIPFKDGYVMVINESLSPENKRKTIKHELEHVAKGDCFNEGYTEYGYKALINRTGKEMKCKKNEANHY